MSAQKTILTDATKVKPNDLMALIHYVKVKQIAQDRNAMVVSPLDKLQTEITVNGRDLIVNALSADYYAEEVPSTMTEMAERLTTAYNRPLTVCFEKADGTERVLRGRFIRSETLLGRSYVEDLDQADDDRLRLVDHRSILWLIVDGRKFVLKGKKK